jgi:hypothetical protein
MIYEPHKPFYMSGQQNNTEKEVIDSSIIYYAILMILSIVTCYFDAVYHIGTIGYDDVFAGLAILMFGVKLSQVRLEGFVHSFVVIGSITFMLVLTTFYVSSGILSFIEQNCP